MLIASAGALALVAIGLLFWPSSKPTASAPQKAQPGRTVAAQADPAPSDESVRRKQAAADQARREAQSAQSKFESFSHAYEELLLDEPDGIDEEAIAPAPQPAVPQQVVTPAWADLRSKLDTLAALRVALLERLTPAHPEVQYLDLQLEDLQGELDRVPQYTAAMVPRPLPEQLRQLPPSGKTAAAQAAANRRRREELARAYEELRQLADAARRSQDRLAEAERIAAEAHALAQRTVPAATVSPVQPAPESSSTGTMAVIVLLGLAAALAGAAFLGREEDPALRSADEARLVLGIPVIGLVPVRGKHDRAA